MQCPVARFGSRKIATGSPEGHLKQNVEVSPLGHLPEPKTTQKKSADPSSACAVKKHYERSEYRGFEKGGQIFKING